MSIILKYPNTTFTNANLPTVNERVLIGSEEDADAHYHFYTDSDSYENSAGDANDLIVGSGSPVGWAATYITIDENMDLYTRLYDSDSSYSGDVTMCAVAKFHVTSSPVGNHDSTINGGLGIIINSNGDISARTRISAVAKKAEILWASVNGKIADGDWYFVAVKCEASSLTVFAPAVSQTWTETTSGVTGYVTPTAKPRIGPNIFPSMTTDIEVAEVIFFGSAKTNAEQLAIYRRSQARMARRGITLP
jgi:hypothetical protein